MAEVQEKIEEVSLDANVFGYVVGKRPEDQEYPENLKEIKEKTE